MLFVVFCPILLAQGQQNGVAELSHPTVDELHQKLNELVQRVVYEEQEKQKNLEKAKISSGAKVDPAAKSKDPGVFPILLEMGGKRTALDRDYPVVYEEILLTLQNGAISSIELKYEESALRRQFTQRRVIKNDDIKKTTYGHITMSYEASGDTPKSEVLVNMSTADRAKLFTFYIDGLLRAIRNLDDRFLASKKFASKRMNGAFSMGIRIR